MSDLRPRKQVRQVLAFLGMVGILFFFFGLAELADQPLAWALYIPCGLLYSYWIKRIGWF